jgi:tRNA threonylcarbamoyladenosine biosynthesis protein TsaE
MIELVLADEAATGAAGAALGGVLAPGDTIGLAGELGAGKTTFVQGLAAGLGVAGPVTSPTFALVTQHAGLVHADLYRIEEARELDEIGLDDAIRAGDAVVVVEWADRFPVLPSDSLWITLVHEGEARRLTARAGGPRASEIVNAWGRVLASR